MYATFSEYFFSARPFPAVKTKKTERYFLLVVETDVLLGLIRIR